MKDGIEVEFTGSFSGDKDVSGKCGIYIDDTICPVDPWEGTLKDSHTIEVRFWVKGRTRREKFKDWIKRLYYRITGKKDPYLRSMIIKEINELT